VLVAAATAMWCAGPVRTDAAPTAEGTLITDPRLVVALQAAGGPQAESVGGGISVELLSHRTDEVVVAVAALGGSVSGTVPGTLVQARLPVSAVKALAASPLVRSVRATRRAAVPPSAGGWQREAVGTGPTHGSQVELSGASAWQSAGFTGSGVKVGIVDYFDFGVWNTAEHGPLPDAAHQKCLDTDSDGWAMCEFDGTIASQPVDGDHGVAVAETIRDMAPGVELFVAWASTLSDLDGVMDWFASNGVTIVNRSLGTAYDGPGDGTGPLADIVDRAAFKGITWFNSAGNDGEDAYMRRNIAATHSGYVSFNDGRPAVGAGTDTWLRIDSAPGSCFGIDGIRWANDWYQPANKKTDYAIEFFEPRSAQSLDTHVNPVSVSSVDPIDLNAIGNQGGTGAGGNVIDAVQYSANPAAATANPLEADDLFVCPTNSYSPYPAGSFVKGAVTFVRIKLQRGSIGTQADQLEIAINGAALLEQDYYDKSGSATKPVVDSRNPALVAVGAVDLQPDWRQDPADPNSIASYSSQGPTNDGRVKPDVSSYAGFDSSVFGSFSGTSAASPTAAGFAALVLGAGLATPGAGLAALVRHFATDLGATGPDSVYGSGLTHLPDPPAPAPVAQPTAYQPLYVPQRILDTRPGASHVGPPELTGPYATQSVIDLDVLGAIPSPLPGTISAVALNITSVASPSVGFLQAYPYLRAVNGATSTLNISTAGSARPNFAVVPVGVGGKVSVYLQAGGHVVVDLLGYYLEQGTDVAAGRFVALATPERWLDTRGLDGAPLPTIFGGTPRRLNAGETVVVPRLSGTAVPNDGTFVDPALAQALVMNVTAVNGSAGGFVRVVPATGSSGATHANLNFGTGAAAGNAAVVALDSFGFFSVMASARVDVIVDVVGYITGTDAPVTSTGTFVPISPVRVYNTRDLFSPFSAGQTRSIPLAGGSTGVPSGVYGVSANLAAVAPSANGFLKMYPGATVPKTSSLNFAAGKTVANGTMVGVNADGTVTATMSQASHLIIDVNGYFVKAPT
jgi:hypothetical protein